MLRSLKSGKVFIYLSITMLSVFPFLSGCEGKNPVSQVDPNTMPIASFVPEVEYITENGSPVAVITCTNYSSHSNRWKWEFPVRAAYNTNSINEKVSERYSAGAEQGITITLTAYSDVKLPEKDTTFTHATTKTVYIHKQQ